MLKLADLQGDWKKAIGNVVCCDCLDLMKIMPEKCIDLVLTDPPYGISRDNNFASMERYNQYKGMDFGEWDKEFDQTKWLCSATRTMKVPSSLVIFNSWQNLKLISDELSGLGVNTKRILVVRKTNPMPVNRDRLFTNSFEFALWATMGANWIFNHRGNYETGFFECKNNGDTPHPTEKQLGVMQDLLKILSNPNNLIFDPFAGSFTTALAAEQLGRRWIACDISPKYAEIGEHRLAKERAQGKLW